MTSQLRVGGERIDFEDAKAWARTYMVDNPGLYAYPAYDAYPGSGTKSVDRQDLLAVALLNAIRPAIPTYYGLESLMDRMNERLEDPDLTGTLATAGPENLEAIARLFGILDLERPKWVELTKLSKVLHLKRPELIPLFDRNVMRCYSHRGDPVPVPPDKHRGWGDYSRAWLPALQHDLVSQLDQWQEIADIAPGHPITPLRALDIVGWKLGKLKIVSASEGGFTCVTTTSTGSPGPGRHDILKTVAGRRSTISYTEFNNDLREETGLSGFDFNTERGRAELGRLLGLIVDRDEKVRPGLMMSALVTQKNGNIPAAGFYNLAKNKEWIHPGDDRDKFWVDQLKALYREFGASQSG